MGTGIGTLSLAFTGPRGPSPEGQEVVVLEVRDMERERRGGRGGERGGENSCVLSMPSSVPEVAAVKNRAVLCRAILK